VFFSCCGSVAWPQVTDEATSNDSTTLKENRRECNLASVHMKLVIFTLLLCLSAECSSPDAAASRRRRQRSKHRPEHHGQVRATHGERRAGSVFGTTAKYCGAKGTAPRAAACAPRLSTCATNNCRGQPPGRHDQLSAWLPLRAHKQIPVRIRTLLHFGSSEEYSYILKNVD
jgi:hypothetical protein